MNAQNAFLRMICMAVLSLVISAQFPYHVSAQTTAPDPQSFLLGTGPIEGTYHPVGIALSTLIKLKLLPSLQVDLTAVNTDGSKENIDLMRQDEVQFAILSALSSHEAEQGTGSFADVGANENLRAITTLWSSTDHVIVRNQSVLSGTIKDLTELRGQKMSFGRSSSGTLLNNRALMEPLGIDVDVDFDLVELGFADSTKAFVDGEIAGMSLSSGLPTRAVQQLFDALGNTAALLEINDEQLAQIDQGRRIWARAVIPAGTYAGQSRDIFTIGTPNILAVRADVDDEVVYQITKAIFENLDYLHDLHQTTGQISLDTAINSLPLPVHEGALRYFAEKDVELPQPPIEVSPDLLARFDSIAEAREVLNKGRISIFAGGNGDTSARIAAELASSMNALDDGFRLFPTFDGGSAQNLTDLLYLQGVDSALVQTDIIAYAREQNIYPDVTKKIAYITEMFPEEVHLIVADGIGNIRDLKGKKVDVGRPGSGTDITASIILSQLNIPVVMTGFGSYAALDKLKRGEISAAFFVGGKPMPLLREIESQSGFRLLSIPFVQFADSYRSTSISYQDYPNLIDAASNDDLPTLAVRTALVTYQWRPGTERHRTMTRFSDGFFDHLRELHQDGNHAKWREVDPTSQISGWQRFESAENWINDHFEDAQRIALEGRFLVDGSLLELLIAGEDDPLAPSSSLDAALSPADPAVLQDEEEASLPGIGGGLEVSAPTVSEPGTLDATAPFIDENPALDPTTAESLRRTLSTIEQRALAPIGNDPLPNGVVNTPTF